MIRKRILGTETEFGVLSKDRSALDTVSNAIFLANSYPHLPSQKILWDYDNENPLLDVRGFEVEGERERPGPEYNRVLNKILPNGGRLYVDGAHPEYSTPECTNALDLVAYEKAGERIMDLCREVASQIKGSEDHFLVYKNNTDGKGNSYGHHENYLVSRSVPFDRIVSGLIPFLVSRQIFTGAGKVGAENKTDAVPYQISQRADFFETLVDLNTMVKRPIINTRDEPHADPKKYRRLHVIVGDSNMAEVATYLKVGSMALVLAMIEEDFLPRPPVLDDPVAALRAVSRDLTVRRPIPLSGGGSATAIEIQRFYLSAAQRYLAQQEPDPVETDVVARWAGVIERLERDPLLLAREVDWVIKMDLIRSYMEGRGCGWDDPRVSLMDLQYHDLRLDKGLYYTLERKDRVERVVDNDRIVAAEQIAPADTRAYFRAACLKKFPKEIYAASWSSVLFDVGNAAIQKVPLMEPLKGTEAMTRGLVEDSGSVKELLAAIAG